MPCVTSRSLQFAQIEPGGKMLALAVQQHRADAVRQRGEEGLDAENGLVVERVALLRPRQPQDRDRALPLGGERGRQFISSRSAIIPPRIHRAAQRAPRAARAPAPESG